MNVRSLFKGFLFLILSLDSLYIKSKALKTDLQFYIFIVSISNAIVCDGKMAIICFLYK